MDEPQQTQLAARAEQPVRHDTCQGDDCGLVLGPRSRVYRLRGKLFCELCATKDATPPREPLCKSHGNPQWHCAQCRDELDALIVAAELRALERVRNRENG